jgi:hypothetical protein
VSQGLVTQVVSGIPWLHDATGRPAALEATLLTSWAITKLVTFPWQEGSAHGCRCLFHSFPARC